MTDRPILFSGPMIRALLERRKTQTRRILKPQPPADMSLVGVYTPALTAVFGYVTPDADFKVPLRFAPGDRLWVREAWRTPENLDDLSPRQIELRCKELGYYGPWCPRVTIADDMAHQWSGEDGFREHQPSGRLRAAMHMPRWASRLTLIVKDVQAERLQEITNEDCIAEGIPVHPNENAPRVGPVQDDFARRHGLISHYGAEYRRLWDSLNASRGFGWETNPWVTALTFDVIRQNIDAIGEA